MDEWIKNMCVYIYVYISSVQLLSHVRLFATSWTAARQASLSITNSRSSPKPMSTELVMPSSHLILCRPLLLLPSIFPSIRVFQMSQLFTSGGQSIGVFQHRSFQWTPRTDLLQDGLGGSPCSPRDSQESSPTPEFKSINTYTYTVRTLLRRLKKYWNLDICNNMDRSRRCYAKRNKSETERYILYDLYVHIAWFHLHV